MSTDRSHRDLIFGAIDQTIGPDDFRVLQELLEQDPEVRTAYLRAVLLAESLDEISSDSSDAVEVGTEGGGTLGEGWLSRRGEGIHRRSGRESGAPDLHSGRPLFLRWLIVGTASAALLAATGIAAFRLGRSNPDRVVNSAAAAEQNAGDRNEAEIAGHAVLRRAVDVVWPEDEQRRLDGDILPNGSFRITEGIVEIEFFCGATLLVEGPAHLDIESDWSVRVSEGRLRAVVPPVARGFVVTAADSEIFDLGTEFALEVTPESARVEVIDGEVELRGGDYSGRHLLTGEKAVLQGGDSGSGVADSLSSVSDIDRDQRQAEQNRRLDWQAASATLSTDSRLLAWFPVALSGTDTRESGIPLGVRSLTATAGGVNRQVSNAAATGRSHDGHLVGPVEYTAGRFGPATVGLNFGRAGARIRTRIDGVFTAFTFVCWAKIDSLDHRYNALFMADGYETGEPHWQIRDDGSLMFSVMVDDTQDVQHFSERDRRVVKQAGLHRVYYTDPIWDMSRSGRWFHLAAVYDPVGRQISQYVNGELISREEIPDRFLISQLRIGAAEIGNWGQPFRKTPWFAVRNLNGTIDELAVFDAALDTGEIRKLWDEGKPVGY